MEEVQHAFARHDEQPVGLGLGRGELRDELGRRDPDRARDAVRLVDLRPDRRTDDGRSPEPPPSARDVEERLVERERLHDWGHRPEDRHHAGRHLAVDPPRRRQDRRLRAPAPRLRHRHRRVHAEAPSLVRRGQHDTAVAATDDHGCPDELRVRAQLDGCEERIHVDVQDRAAFVVAGKVGWRPAQLLAAAHDVDGSRWPGRPRRDSPYDRARRRRASLGTVDLPPGARTD